MYDFCLQAFITACWHSSQGAISTEPCAFRYVAGVAQLRVRRKVGDAQSSHCGTRCRHMINSGLYRIDFVRALKRIALNERAGWQWLFER